MSSSQIFCPNCGSFTPAENINISAMAGKCNECDRVFQLPQQPVKNYTGQEQIDLGGQPPARPKSITRESGPGGELYLKRSWFSPALFFMLFFCIAWDSFLFFWYTTALTQAGTPWLMIVFPIGHVAVGVGLTYSVVAGFLNKTHIFVDQHSLIVKHRPIPWFSNKEVNVKDISEFQISRKQSSNDGQQLGAYHVVATVSGDENSLVSGLNESAAKYVAFELANQLKVNVRYGTIGGMN